MDRSERALFNEGQRWMRTPTFRKNAMKIMEGKYNTLPRHVPMLPVEITKRLKVYYGMCYYNRKIAIAHYHWKGSPRNRVIQTLRHEYLHQWVRRNHVLVSGRVSLKKFEKECFYTFGFKGDHGAYKYRYTGNKCRCWYKSNEVKKVWHCQCGKIYATHKKLKEFEEKGYYMDWFSQKGVKVPVSEIGVLKKKILIRV